jgi:hypothetical protein
MWHQKKPKNKQCQQVSCRLQRMAVSNSLSRVVLLHPHVNVLFMQVVRCCDLGQAEAAAGQQDHDAQQEHAGQHKYAVLQQEPAAEGSHHHHHHHHQHQHADKHTDEECVAVDRHGFGRRCDKQLVVHLLHLNHSLHLPP